MKFGGIDHNVTKVTDAYELSLEGGPVVSDLETLGRSVPRRRTGVLLYRRLCVGQSRDDYLSSYHH